MRKTKKQLLGLAGLAVVGIMTAVACTIPAPDAAAAEGDEVSSEEGASSETGVGVEVQILSGNPRVSTTSIADGDWITNGEPEIATSYERVSHIFYNLKYTGRDGKTTEYTLPDFTPTDESGIHKFTLDLSRYGGYGTYVLTTSATGYNGTNPQDDVVSFTYSAAVTTVESTPAENGEPIINVEVNNEVEKIYVQAYDKKGNPIFVDKDGNETPVALKRSDLDPETGKFRVQLPFEKYGAQPGEYTVIVEAQDDANTVIAMNTVVVKYAPGSPDVPNTGMLNGNEFNITRVDFLLTGLIAFAVVAGFAIALVFRNSRR